LIQDIYDPAERYHSEFCGKFKKIAEDTFDDLLKLSGIDIEENQRIVNKIRFSEQIIRDLKSRITKLRVWQIVLWLVIIACIAVGFNLYENPYNIVGSIGAGVLSLYLIFGVLGPRKKKAKEELEQEYDSVEKDKAIAWEQMKPLNRLFDWDVTVRMITKTVPRIQFDPFFTEGRLRELHSQFDWDDEYNSDKSVLFAHSGEINGNPFILGRTMYMRWGEKTYYGEKRISYRVRSGKNSYTRTETLRAKVTKPFPEYPCDTFLIYGCDAAPNLVFHRSCSGLANDEDSFWGKRNKKAEQKMLEKFSRNLEDESQYTMMSNQDFETLFNTMDRNDEVEFRLLFTPIAQTQMLKIMRDKTDGFGDDFSFNKANKLNVIQAQHLKDLELDNNPDRYKNYSIEDSRHEFMMYNQQYFRALYFAFAPLLAIPLYQQIRTHENIYNIKENRRSCFWEHEALANFYGDKHFEHPDCATHSILKTSEKRVGGDRANIEVTAYGYRAEPRVDVVSVLGGDHRHHNVKVHWEEYLPVQRTSEFRIEEDPNGFAESNMNATERAEYIRQKEDSVHGGVYRRSVLSRAD